jgi:hypothetical protein
MSEIRTTRSDGERTTDADVNLHRSGDELNARHPGSSSSPVGVYDRPAGAGSGANYTLLWILLILVIVVIAFLAYRWWF